MAVQGQQSSSIACTARCARECSLCGAMPQGHAQHRRLGFADSAVTPRCVPLATMARSVSCPLPGRRWRHSWPRRDRPFRVGAVRAAADTRRAGRWRQGAMSFGPASTNGAGALFTLAAHSRQRPVSFGWTKPYAPCGDHCQPGDVTGAPHRRTTSCPALGNGFALRIAWRHPTTDRGHAGIGGMSTTSRCRQYRTVQTVGLARWHSCASDELP